MLDSDGKVNYLISKKKVIIVSRGTKELSDWSNNIIYGVNVNAYKLTSIIKQQNECMKKQKRHIQRL